MVVRGTEVVARNIKSFGGGFIGQVNRTMAKVKTLMDISLTKNITLTDHSLEDLASLGHPYSKRHGPQGMRLHEPSYQVHTQSGELLGAKKSFVIPARIAGGELVSGAVIGLDENKAKHAVYVIFGTSRGQGGMVPRPVLSGSRDEVAEKALLIIGTDLKGLVINFRPT